MLLREQKIYFFSIHFITWEMVLIFEKNSKNMKLFIQLSHIFVPFLNKCAYFLSILPHLSCSPNNFFRKIQTHKKSIWWSLILIDHLEIFLILILPLQFSTSSFVFKIRFHQIKWAEKVLVKILIRALEIRQL